MKTVIVIQARLGSSRLPCKTLLNLHGLPVIDWVVGRCARSELADDLVVALPDTRRDEVLARHLRAQGVNIFRGSEQDVLSRMHGAAAAHGADLVVRVCADNPLIWGGEIDNLIRFYQREHAAGNCDYAYNHIPRNNLYPDGLGAEIVSFELLEAARWLSYLKPDGQIVTSTQQIDPMPVITGAAQYPENLVEKMKAAGAKVDALDLSLIHI